MSPAADKDFEEPKELMLNWTECTLNQCEWSLQNQDHINKVLEQYLNDSAKLMIPRRVGKLNRLKEAVLNLATVPRYGNKPKGIETSIIFVQTTKAKEFMETMARSVIKMRNTLGLLEVRRIEFDREQNPQG